MPNSDRAEITKMTTKKSTTSEVRPTPKSSDLEKFFSLYKEENSEDGDDHQERIGPAGMMKLCEALTFDPADVCF